MKLGYLLKDMRPIDVMFRVTLPDGEDSLMGYARWTGAELVSEDDDSYSFDEEVVVWDVDGQLDMLIITLQGECFTGENW